METCENCGTVIGKLETPMLMNEHVVCGPCYTRLAKPPTTPPVTPPPSASVSMCPHCNVPLTKSRGLRGPVEVLVFLVLFVAGLLPGIVYYVMVESTPHCQSCSYRHWTSETMAKVASVVALVMFGLYSTYMILN
jgi:hypothetical protein